VGYFSDVYVSPTLVASLPSDILGSRRDKILLISEPRFTPNVDNPLDQYSSSYQQYNQLSD